MKSTIANSDSHSQRPVKVVQLSSIHPPLDMRIFHRHCRTLADAGYEVVLIVPRPHRCEAVEGMVKGVRVRLVSSSRSRPDRMTRIQWQLWRAAIEEDADVYHFHDFELIGLGLLLKLRGKTVVYDAHEDLPADILDKPWIPRRLRRMVAWVARVMLAIATSLLDGVVSATPAISRALPRSAGAVVQNYPRLDDLAPAPRRHYSRAAEFVYMGVITRERGIRELMRALAALSPSSPARLLLAGLFDGADLKEEVARMPGWQRVEYFGWIGRGGLLELTDRARAGLLTFHPVANHWEAQPQKMFEYMAAGLPVIASDFPLWRSIIDESRCGLLVDPGNPREIADAMQWILDHPEESQLMGARGRSAVVERYNWDRESQRLLSFYAGIRGSIGCHRDPAAAGARSVAQRQV